MLANKQLAEYLTVLWGELYEYMNEYSPESSCEIFDAIDEFFNLKIEEANS